MQPLGKAIPSNAHGMPSSLPLSLRYCLWAMHAHKFAQSAMSEANGELTHVAATNLISYLLPKQRLPPEQKRPRHARLSPPPSSLPLLHAVGSSSRQQQSSRFRASPLAIWPDICLPQTAGRAFCLHSAKKRSKFSAALLLCLSVSKFIRAYD